jgi:hypothetical protein
MGFFRNLKTCFRGVGYFFYGCGIVIGGCVYIVLEKVWKIVTFPFRAIGMIFVIAMNLAFMQAEHDEKFGKRKT